MGGSGKSANHPFDLARFDQSAHVNPSVYPTMAVGDAGKALGPQPVQGCHQVLGCADPAETGKHDGGAVGYVGHRLVKSLANLVLH